MAEPQLAQQLVQCINQTCGSEGVLARFSRVVRGLPEEYHQQYQCTVTSACISTIKKKVQRKRKRSDIMEEKEKEEFTNRKGGPLQLNCDYQDRKGVSHQSVLKSWLELYNKETRELAGTKKGTRKKPIRANENNIINAAKDLDLCIDGKWISMSDFIPTKVRELDPHAVREFIDERTEKDPIESETKSTPQTDIEMDVIANVLQNIQNIKPPFDYPRGYYYFFFSQCV